MAPAPRALRIVAVGVASATLGAAGPARAQPAPTTSSKVTAEALFVEGRRLVSAGQYAEACPKFADSQRLDPSPATLLNLASCYERLGRTATAWATYREAASAANATGRHEFFVAAQRHAEALVAHLSRLTITVTEPVDGIEIKRDGTVVDRAEWGIPIPLDPGPHLLAAAAPGYRAWTNTFEVARDAPAVGVTVPALEALPRDEAAAAAAATPATAPSSGEPSPAVAVVPSSAAHAVPDAPGDPGATQRTVGWVMGAVGVASLLTGGGFAIAAKARYNDSLGNCQTGNPNVCSSLGVDQRNQAITRGNIATWTVVGGAVAAAAGLTFVLTAPHGTGHAAGSSGSARAASWMLFPTLGGAAVEGRF
jgi:hypothetical protein